MVINLTLSLTFSVIQFLGICAQPGQPLCLVSTFLDGGSLYHFMRNQRNKDLLTAATTQIKLASGIAAGMQHLASEARIQY